MTSRITSGSSRLKFRIYDGQGMREVFSLSGLYDPDRAGAATWAMEERDLSHRGASPLSKIWLMQSTGRLDYNGKDIFEGDLVRVPRDELKEAFETVLSMAGKTTDQETWPTQPRSSMIWCEDHAGYELLFWASDRVSRDVPLFTFSSVEVVGDARMRMAAKLGVESRPTDDG